jgi:alkaline phosphatase
MKQLAIIIAIYLFNGCQNLQAQPKIYSMQNAHAHNDYLHEKPFFEAFSLNYGMIEADIFIQNDELVVAHERKSIKSENTLSSLYINPLLEKIKANNGRVYPDGQKLRLLIDIKEDGEQVLRLLEKQLKPYRNFFDLKHNENAVQIIISGDMPKGENFKNFDNIFYFDGRKKVEYSKKNYKRIALVSNSILDFVKWNKSGIYSETETLKLRNFVDSVHHTGKLVRFWATPNTVSSFKTMTDLGVDFIGSDDLVLLAEFIKKLTPSNTIQNH